MSMRVKRRVTAKYTAIDLFCGCGGLTQGLKEAGFSILAGIDSDALAIETYRKNHRKPLAIKSSVYRITGTRLLRLLGLKPGQLDLLAGCPPCQPFSELRRKKGTGAVRDKAMKDMVLRFLYFVRELKPKCVLIENVPYLIRDKRMSHVRACMRSMGYHGTAEIKDAYEYGVPQRRKRMVYMAKLNGPLPMVRPLDQKERITVRKTIGNIPKVGTSGDPLHDLGSNHSETVLKILRTIPKNGGSRNSLPKSMRLHCHLHTNGFSDVYGRMAWDGPSPTITGGCINPSKGRYIHPEENRAISLREAALLQSFPIGYYISLKNGKYAAAQMIGNAFPPLFGKFHGIAIKASLRSKNNSISRGATL